MLPTMTVAENVFIDALPQYGGLVDRRTHARANGAGSSSGWART